MFRVSNSQHINIKKHNIVIGMAIVIVIITWKTRQMQFM